MVEVVVHEKGDGALHGELHGVRKQVYQHLLCPLCVEHELLRDVVMDVEVKSDFLFPCLDQEHLVDQVHLLADVAYLGVDCELPVLHLEEIQQVMH